MIAGVARVRLAVVAVVVTTACAHAPAVGYGRSSCPIAPQARPYSIRVTGERGIGRDILQTVADALAGGWGSEEELPSPREAAILASLQSLVDDPAYHGFGAWRPEPGDTATAQVVYRDGQRPQLRITSGGVRSEMQRRVSMTFDRAVAIARQGAFDDALPLALLGDSVVLAVRFGWEPSAAGVAADDTGLAVFALNQEDPKPKSVQKFLMYPEEMRAMNIEGSVRLAFVISRDGQVDTTSVRTLEATSAEFLTEARRRIREFRFHPATLNCEAIPVVAIQPMNWRLNR